MALISLERDATEMMKLDKHANGANTINSVKQTKSIALELAISLVAATLISATITIGAGLWWLKQSDTQHYENKASEYSHFLSQNLSLPVWNYDDEAIQVIGNTFAKNEIVSMVEISDETGQVLYYWAQPGENGLITEVKPIEFDGETIGFIKLGITSNSWGVGQRELMFSLFILTVNLVVLAGVTGYFLRRSLKKPFDLLIDDMGQISKGTYTFSQKLYEYVEFRQIITQFNQMVDDVHRREHELAASEERYRTLFERSGDAIFLVNAKTGQYINANQAAERLTGYTALEIKTKTTRELSPKGAEKRLDHALSLETATNFGEVTYARADGTERVAILTAFPIQDGELVVGIAHDITERKQAEQMIKDSEERLKILFESAPDAYYLNDLKGNLIDGNKAAETLLGYKKEELIGKNITKLNLLPATELPKTIKILSRNAMGQSTEPEEITLTRKDGNRISVEIRAHPVKIGGKTVVLGIARDITKRKQDEESLRQLNQAIEQSPVSVMITNVHGVIQYVNPRFTQVTGYSTYEAIGQTPDLLHSGYHPPEFYQELWNTITTGGEWRGEFHNRKKNGDLYWELGSIAGVKDKNGNITHYVSVKEDITQRKQLEEETARQERLAAVGQLAAGIAHDFNNMLTTIMGYAELLQTNSDLTESTLLDLERIVKQSQRAAQLIRQILDFSRQTVNEPQPLDMKVYLNDTLSFIERTIPENIQIQSNFERGNHSINADPTQMQQIITNLAVNARDAMPHGGTLHFDLARLVLTQADTPPCSDMEAGDWVRLAVTDTGSGIDPKALPHIFEPFFTTKEVGQGTGLGLAQIYGIVKQHNGCITVNSWVGKGTTFTLYFPALFPIQATAKTEADETIPKGQGETILLVEDEQTVLDVTQSMLNTLNYKILTAKDGAEALAVYRDQADQIALVLTDVVMPGMDGFALASALQTEAPEIKVLLMTGYARDSDIGKEARHNIAARLQKPIRFQQLAQALRKVLD